MGDHRLPPDPRTMATATHARTTYQIWSQIQADRLTNASAVVLDGESLSLAQVIAVAKHGSKPVLDKRAQIVDKIDQSVEMLKRHLDRGDLVYGVNTGYGGSADTRTNDLSALQHALVQHQQSGILTVNDTARSLLGTQQVALHQAEDFGSLSMPTSWVKGLMLQRVNSIIRGHSAVSLPVIEAIMALLRYDITPVIPLRGSISASGDLQPLSYVAGAIEGSPDIFVRVGSPPVIMSASEALKACEIQPVVLAAKEGLGLLNGTAASVSAASLALYESNQLALLTQALTAMAVEALRGTAESFSPFIAKVRPHRGQVEVASNIYGFLQGSRLASGLITQKDMHISGLCQDRYPLRTSSQWIGPQLEDLILATEQISVELNSTTDNPLIDVEDDLIHHGGNFQAASITSAMEKTRNSLQMFGKLLFAQGTELINSALNKGLPPNLAADDPSLSFTCKGVDINLAAYMSELAFLANPVSSHVQSAELHNQAVNSLALISARYTLQSVEVLAQMCAAYLFTLCQALDLRVMQSEFLAAAHSGVRAAVANALKDAGAAAPAPPPPCNSTVSPSSPTPAPSPPPPEEDAVVSETWDAVKGAWDAATSMDLAPRSAHAARAGALVFQYHYCNITPAAATAVRSLEQQIKELLSSAYASAREHMFVEHKTRTPEYLGRASRRVYCFVRQELGVPLHRGLVEHPTYGGVKEGEQQQRRTVGSWVSVIYEALRAGLLHRPVMEALEEGGV